MILFEINERAPATPPLPGRVAQNLKEIFDWRINQVLCTRSLCS